MGAKAAEGHDPDNKGRPKDANHKDHPCEGSNGFPRSLGAAIASCPWAFAAFCCWLTGYTMLALPYNAFVLKLLGCGELVLGLQETYTCSDNCWDSNPALHLPYW